MLKPHVVNAIYGRDDLSPFVVHLTRDDSGDFTNGNAARENLHQMLIDRRILAVRPHCIYNKEIEALDEEASLKCSVACFTEVPLSQIHRLTGVIPGRATKLEPYGIVFRKDRLINAGAQPAIYVNSYGKHNHLREAYRDMFNIAKIDLKSKFWRIVPLLNTMNEQHDFSWEREWRMCETFNFTLADVVCVILPEDSKDKLKSLAAKAGVAVISPGLNYEQIILELSSQQRTTKTVSTTP
ncbi:hypothetical protein [Collimonas humicola]|uniref:hypothetical protein n=1 Tax=Collimonas humicola TaxID=2825886 RepID=UPI001B8C0CD6|nr:hypothetical protein [Collimonas humicola]